MSKWQNLELRFFNPESTAGKYNIPQILPVYELPEFTDIIEFDYCRRFRSDRYDRSKCAVHFFEDDYKFERVWTSPDRYGESLSEFSFVMGPDFSTFIDFPLAVRIYNHYRNCWLCRYWQDAYKMTVIPTILFGLEDSWDWCFDGYPTNSIVAISDVGRGRSAKNKDNFLAGYNEMLKRLNPYQIIVHTKSHIELPGNTLYLPWKLFKGDQIDV